MKIYNKPQVQDIAALEAILTAACVLDDATPTNTAILKTRDKATGALIDYMVGDEGAVLSDLQVAPVDTRAADIVCYLFVSLDGGTTMRLRGTAKVATQTPSATVAPVPAVFSVNGEAISVDKPLRLPKGAKLYVGAASAVTAGLVVTGVSNEYAVLA